MNDSNCKRQAVLNRMCPELKKLHRRKGAYDFGIFNGILRQVFFTEFTFKFIISTLFFKFEIYTLHPPPPSLEKLRGKKHQRVMFDSSNAAS